MVSKVRASHILVNDEATANSVIDQYADGVKFEVLAKKYSSCPSKSKGGDLGWFGKGSMVKPFETAAFNAEPGDVVKCKTEFGWHVILVTGKK